MSDHIKLTQQQCKFTRIVHLTSVTLHQTYTSQCKLTLLCVNNFDVNLHSKVSVQVYTKLTLLFCEILVFLIERSCAFQFKFIWISSDFLWGLDDMSGWNLVNVSMCWSFRLLIWLVCWTLAEITFRKHIYYLGKQVWSFMNFLLHGFTWEMTFRKELPKRHFLCKQWWSFMKCCEILCRSLENEIP